MRLFTAMAALLALSVSAPAHAVENCTKENKRALCDEKVVKAKVDWACKILAEKGKDGIAEIRKDRFDCCGEPDFVWINDQQPKMLLHPIMPRLESEDLTNTADADGKKIYVEFAKAAKAKPKGSWIDHKGTKLGDSDQTPKRSWVRSCTAKGEKESWVVGSSTWY